MTAIYGLIGYPLSHSFSPAYFTKKFAHEYIRATYQLFPLSNIDQFPALLKSTPGLKGLNVTIPYKEAVIKYLNILDPVAESVGAVNCILVQNGICKGYNTDITGFEESLSPLLLPHHTNALILGTGGAAKTVAYVLDKLGIAYKFVSRRKRENIFTYHELTPEIISQHTLIINTTPVGMSPYTNHKPDIPYAGLGKKHLLYDLIYNPSETGFLVTAKEHGSIIKNGMEMLELQAEASWKIWKQGKL